MLTDDLNTHQASALRWYPIVALFLAVLFTIVFVPPVGDFPLNDDWVYGKSVANTLSEGRLVVHPYASALGLTHIGWGVLWSGLLGQSYNVLRLSTLVWSVAGCLAVATCARSIGLTRLIAMLCGLLLWINPFYLNLSYTFMSDASFTAQTALAGLFYVRSIQSYRVRDLVLAGAFSGSATLMRQFGIILPMAYAIARLYAFRTNGEKPNRGELAAFATPWLPTGLIALYWSLTRATDSPLLAEMPLSSVISESASHMQSIVENCVLLVAFLLPIVAAVGYDVVKRRSTGVSVVRRVVLCALVSIYVVSMWRVIAPGPLAIAAANGLAESGRQLLTLVWWLLVTLMYIGLFIFPLGFARLSELWTERKRLSRTYKFVFWTITLLSLAIGCALGATRLPVLSNMLYDLGVGPLTLTDAYKLNRGWSPISLGGGWWVITLAAILSAAALVTDALSIGTRTSPSTIDSKTKQAHLFLAAWAVLILVSLQNPFLVIVYDRYFLQGLPPCILLAAVSLGTGFSKSPSRIALTSVMMLLMFGFSVCSLHDYLAWNRARWEAADYLMSHEGISPAHIDGGYEFNGTYTSDISLSKNGYSGLLEESKNWWVQDDTYAISFQPRAGYDVLREIPYTSWLQAARPAVRILKRTSAPATLSGEGLTPSSAT